MGQLKPTNWLIDRCNRHYRQSLPRWLMKCRITLLLSTSEPDLPSRGVMRRVDCPQCGVKVEQVPWCDGKHSLTTTYRWFLAGWAKRLSWKGVAEAFGTTWHNVFRSVKHAVLWGLGGLNAGGRDAFVAKYSVPEPASLGLLLIGVMFAGARRRPRG